MCECQKRKFLFFFFTLCCTRVHLVCPRPNNLCFLFVSLLFLFFFSFPSFFVVAAVLLVLLYSCFTFWQDYVQNLSACFLTDIGLHEGLYSQRKKYPDSTHTHIHMRACTDTMIYSRRWYARTCDTHAGTHVARTHTLHRYTHTDTHKWPTSTHTQVETHTQTHTQSDTDEHIYPHTCVCTHAHTY